MLFADFTPYVALELPGCDDFIVQRVAREELYALYRQRPLWLYADTPSVDTSGVVTFSLPAQTVIHDVRSFRIDKSELTPAGEGSLNQAAYEVTGAPEWVFLQNDQWIVRPMPVEAASANAVVQLGPSATATEVPDTLAAKHRPLWEHLVLTRLQAMAGQEWTNPKAASYHAAEATRLIFEEQRRADGWTSRRAPVVRYGGI